MRADLVFYVSGHGFGHAKRIGALIRAIRNAATENLAIAVRSEAPAWIFRERDVDVRCSPAPIDVGVIQTGGLDLDLPATLAAHEALADSWGEALEREARWIRQSGAMLVVGDIPALAFAAAERAGVRAVAVANFSWDWILDAYADSQPRWAPIVERYRHAYGHAERLFRLPLHGDLSAFGEIVDAPLLVNRAQRDTNQCRESLGISAGESRRVVLISFGGHDRNALRAGTRRELDDYLFVGVGPRPDEFAGDWLALQGPSAIPHEELICASDAVVGKPGFSTVAEIFAHRKRFLFLDRENYRETRVLVDALDASGCAREMPRADFDAGHWCAHLDALFGETRTPPEIRCDGAEVIATALLEML